MPLQPDHPDPIVVFTAGGEHGVVAVAVGAEAALADGVLSIVDDLDGGGTLVRIHTGNDPGQRRFRLRS